MSGVYDWKEINERLVKAVKSTSSAVAIKFLESEEELNAIPNVKVWKDLSTVCSMIGIAAYWNITVALTGEQAKAYCGGNNGIVKRDENWYNGVALNSAPIKWHGTPEASKAHMQAILEESPRDDYYAVVCSPIASGDIVDPDAVIISAEPGAAFYLFAGFVESDWKELNFTFRGESTCVETWIRTKNKGIPGVSLGCRGDRCNGALGNHEVRLSISVQDLLKALEGCERLDKDGVQYPFWPVGIIDVNKL